MLQARAPRLEPSKALDCKVWSVDRLRSIPCFSPLSQDLSDGGQLHPAKIGGGGLHPAKIDGRHQIHTAGHAR